MACVGRYATADEFAQHFCMDLPLSAEQQAAIERNLDLAASEVHAAMAANDMCDCTLAGWATTYLKTLNIRAAAALYDCECGRPHLTNEERRDIIDWTQNLLENVRMGNIELCDGETGREYPVADAIEMAVDEFSTARIIYNTRRRS